MIRTEAFRILVLDLDEQGQTADEIAATLRIPVSRVDRILDDHDAAQGVPHQDRVRAPVLEPLGGPAVIVSQAASGGGRGDRIAAAVGRKRINYPEKREPPTRDIKCGTLPGYYQHRRAKESACQPCRDAYNTHRRDEQATPRKVIECGTVAGYYRHRRQGTPTCAECKAAYNVDDRIRRPRKGSQYEPRGLVECGTVGGRSRHKREGTPVCDPCRDAYNASQRDAYLKRGKLVKNPYKPIAHGTSSGIKAHQRRGEKPCADCRIAWSEYKRQYKQRKEMAS